MLMDLKTLQWNPDNCSEFGIPIKMLPSIRSSSEIYGHVFAGPLKGVPIAGVSSRFALQVQRVEASALLT
jgi:glycerol kinase